METETRKKKGLMETLDKLAENPKLRDWLYLVAFAVMIGTCVLQNSMLRDVYGAQFYAQNVAAVVIGVKMLIYDRKHIYIWLIALPVIFVARLLWMRFNYFTAFSLAVCVVGAYGINFEKIAKTCFFTALAVLAVIVTLSQVGVIKDLCYESQHPFGIFHIRHSFGIIYTTDFAAYIFFILVTFFAAFQKFDKFFYLRALVPFIVAPVVYCLCITRLDCLCILLLGVGMILVGLFHGFEDRTAGAAAVIRKVFEQLCIWSMPILSVFFIAITLAYTEASPLLVKLDTILSGRLALGKQGFEQYPVTLFGQYFEMYGLGSTEQHDFSDHPYFFLDSSYIYCLLRMGLVFTLMLIGAYVILGLRNRHNHIILLGSALTALNCMIAHHLHDVSYAFLIVAVLAEGGIALEELFRRKKTGDEPQPAGDEGEKS